MSGVLETGEGCVLTFARDVSGQGGGVAGVAVPLHRALLAEGLNCALYHGGVANRIEQAHAWDWSKGIEAKPRGSVVHVHGLWTAFEVAACREALRHGLKLVVSPHGMLDPWALRQKAMKKTLAWYAYQKRLLERANLLIVNSERERESVRRLGLKGAVAVIPNGVAVEDWSRSMTRRAEQPVILFLSRVAPGKGVAELLQAWSQISDKRGYRLRIVGDAEFDYRKTLIQLVERLGVQGSVSLEGGLFGKDKWQAFCDASYFVLPSHSENFGIVVAEALVAGIPVITTDQTPWQRLQQEGAGWICGISAVQIQQALESAMALSDTDRSLMSQKAQQISKDYDWTEIAQRYRQAYRWLQGRQSKPEWVECMGHA